MTNVQDRLEATLVRIREQGGRKRTGTGFFVAPGLILTCAHVVEPDPKGAVLSMFDLQVDGQIWTGQPTRIRPDGHIDLALFEIPDANRPCVLLGGAADPFARAFGSGFVSKPNEVRTVPFAGEIEGEMTATLLGDATQYALIKFKATQIEPGMSGAPLVNVESGAVCGVVARTRDAAFPAGGLAVPFRLILANYPEIVHGQAAYHNNNADWRLFEIHPPTGTQTRDEKIKCLSAFPRGPAFDLSYVDPNLIDRFVRLKAVESVALINAANYLRVQVERQGAKPSAITIADNMLDPAAVGLKAYWLEAFAAAAVKGPRMLAALLYEAPAGHFDGFEDVLRVLLAQLRVWPIH